MTNTITLVGGKGGVGKTISSINLGSAMNYFGKNTAVVDANLTTPNIGIYLGVPLVPVSLHDVLKKKNHISEATYLHPSGLKIIPGDISIDQLKNIDPALLEKSILELEGIVDYVIIDGAAGLGREAISAIKSAEKVLIITNPEMPAVTDALKTIQIAQSMKKQILGVVLTRARLDSLDIPVNEIERILEYPVLEIIPEDENIRKSIFAKNPVLISHPNTKASIAYKRLAAKLLGKRFQAKVKEESFFNKIINLFRLK